ncbi:dihydrofolate reductase family protein [Xylanimonas ulmi]|uniref:Dihydrofolate reductase n=1 Tax=Xylanimonas ulmi TaxID=228973 RepID=A0A4Q7M166_9MICO|nr:dihydrofolate reductase family protein [Xylanibacterium ulmi]RZS60961.1 dihydrofolate reductase [Xylanibacterium ulmi]
MGTLRYTAICSIDGCTARSDGQFDFATPSAEVHAAVNAAESDVRLEVYGRRMWETMEFWATDAPLSDAAPDVVREFALQWRATPKVIASDSLAALDVPGVPGVRLEPRLTPERLAAIVAEADGVVSIGGATVAGVAVRAGLVDDVQLYVVPHTVGGGLRALPDGVEAAWRLRETRVFADGVVWLRYGRA